MKKHSGTILLVLIFFVGLAVMLYPTISDYINQRNQTRVVNSYAQQVDSLSDADYTAYFDAADVFNQEIAADPDALYHADHFSTYSTTLDVTGTGIMGYITIPRIGVELPIYHGTSDAVLQVAAGHLEGTSLPVGGESTHAVISAHRGLPSAKLFTHLDRLEVGDTFTITVLDRELTYEVDKISIVLPTEVDELKVVDGKDYVTLMTCTPYGINTHRLLITGTRVPNHDECPPETGCLTDGTLSTTAFALTAIWATLTTLARHSYNEMHDRRSTLPAPWTHRIQSRKTTARPNRHSPRHRRQVAGRPKRL